MINRQTGGNSPRLVTSLRRYGKNSLYLGIENLPFFFTRGILLDVPAYLGLEVLPDAYAITSDDIIGTLERQNIDLYGKTQKNITIREKRDIHPQIVFFLRFVV
jgi:hypothetical protein